MTQSMVLRKILDFYLAFLKEVLPQAIGFIIDNLSQTFLAKDFWIKLLNIHQNHTPVKCKWLPAASRRAAGNLISHKRANLLQAYIRVEFFD